MAKLTSHVHVSDPEHGAAVFGPNDEVPEWAYPHITNPKAWEDGDVPGAPAADAASDGEPAKGSTSRRRS